jgi:hypothetical protein
MQRRKENREFGKSYVSLSTVLFAPLRLICRYIVEKIQKQLELLDHVMFADFTHPAAMEEAHPRLKADHSGSDGNFFLHTKSIVFPNLPRAMS